MDRRVFLRNCALLAAGTVALDQLELLERLAPKRLWAGYNFTPPYRLHQLADSYRKVNGGKLSGWTLTSEEARWCI